MEQDRLVREPGYYWVEDHDGWTIGKWDQEKGRSGCWWLIGTDEPIDDVRIKKVGPRIEEYRE